MTQKEFYDRLMLTLTSMKDRYQLETVHDALIVWFAENYLFLDPEEVKDRIVKDTHAEGVDAILIDSLNHNLLFIQAKTVDNFSKTTSMFRENAVKLTLQGVHFLLRGDTKGKITPSLENLVNEYHELDRSECYRTKVLFLILKQPPISDKFVQHFREEIPQVEVEFLDFGWFFKFYNDVYLVKTAPPPPQVSFSMINKSLGKDAPYKSRVFTTKGVELARVYDEHGEKILQQNVRYFLGLRSKSINQQIQETAVDDKSNNFWYFNNGVTMVCTDITETTAGTIIKLQNPQIINGAQTTYAMHDAYKNGKLKDDVEIIIKAIQTSDKEFMESVTLYTNSQNSIRLRDLCSNDRIQRTIQTILLEAYGYFYERKRGEVDTFYPTPEAKKNAFGVNYKDMFISNENAAQAFLATYLAKPAQAKSAKGLIFQKENGGFYYEIFNEDDSLLPERLLMSWKLLKYVEKQKMAYKTQYAQAEELVVAERNNIYKYDFLLHGEYFIINIFVDFLKNRGFDIDHNKDHILRIISVINSCSKEMEEDYETIKNELAKFVDIAKKDPGYYHNKFFKNEKSIALVRSFLGKKYKFIAPLASKEVTVNAKCPVCGKVATSWMNLARHFVASPEPKHLDWIESNGLSYPTLLGLKDGKLEKGNLKPLADKLEQGASKTGKSGKPSKP